MGVGWGGIRAKSAAEQGGHGRTRHRSLQVRCHISILIEYCGGWGGVRLELKVRQNRVGMVKPAGILSYQYPNRILWGVGGVGRD